MNSRTAVLIDACAAVGAGDVDRLREALRAAAEAVRRAPSTGAADEVTATEVEEALLQCYLFVGYPAALRALGEWRAISGRAAPSASMEEPALWSERGALTCERVYGGQYRRLRANIAVLHPDMESWMVTEGYGKVLGRPGLDLVTRELCVIAVLAPQDAAPQLYSHLRGALNAGASVSLVDRVVERLSDGLPGERGAALDEQWRRVRARMAGTQAGESGAD